MTAELESSPRGVRIVYDRGTLVVEGTPPERVLLPGAVWDDRVDVLRAPGRRHREIVAALRAAGAPFVDGAVDATRSLPLRPAPALRPYQALALDAWEAADRRGVVVLPTGSGKTHVALAAIARSRKPTLCLVPTCVLLAQWRAVLVAAFGDEVGVYGDGERELRPVTVATFESAWRHMADIGDRFDLVVVDEAHHFGSGVRDEALEMSVAHERLGLTATPPKGSSLHGIAELIGPVVFELGVRDLVGTFLAELEVVELSLGLTEHERARHDADWIVFRAAFDRFRKLAPMGDWRDFQRWATRTAPGRESLVAWRRARATLALTEAKLRVVGTLLAQHADTRTLVFTASKEAAYRIAREHLVMPITADIGSAEREASLKAFQDGQLRALVSARVLNEGVDVPDASVGIVVGGAHGEREHVQRVGRVLRPAPNKRAVVYHLVTSGTSEVGAARRMARGLTS